MSIARQHHFLPEFYLAGFTREGNSDGFLHILDTVTGKRWKHRPADVAKRRDLYAIEASEFPKDELEKGFSWVENWIAPILKEVLEQKRLPDDAISFDVLLNLVSMTWARVPATRKILASPIVGFGHHVINESVASAKNFQKFCDRMRAFGRDPQYSLEELRAFVERGAFAVDADQNTHLQNLISANDSALVFLAQLSWRLLSAANGAPDFVLTDDPVLRVSDKRHARFLNHKFREAPTSIYFPLSRRVVLHGTVVPTRLPSISFPSIDVVHLNGLMLSRADRFVYSAGPHFTWAQNGVMRTTSELREMLNRRRIRDEHELKDFGSAFASRVFAKSA